MGPSAPRGLRQGTLVGSGFAGIRVFADRRNGFAITELAGAGEATYPVATGDGGRRWRTDGPVLHVTAAQGALAVNRAGIAFPRTYFAWCGVCGNVVDVTPDAGKHWWQTFLPGQVLSILGTSSGRPILTAIVEGPTADPRGRSASLWVYASNTGRRWTFRGSMSAVS